MKSGGSKRGRSWRAREREPITGVWGRSPQRGPGAEPLVRGSGGLRPPKAEKLFAFRRPLEAANLPLFSLYCRLSKLLKFSIQQWQWGMDLGVTWVCVHDLTWHQKDLKVDEVTTSWLDLTWSFRDLGDEGDGWATKLGLPLSRISVLIFINNCISELELTTRKQCIH